MPSFGGLVPWTVARLLLRLLQSWLEDADADAANNSHHTRQTLINPQSQQGGGHVTSLGSRLQLRPQLARSQFQFSVFRFQFLNGCEIQEILNELRLNVVNITDMRPRGDRAAAAAAAPRTGF